MDEDYDKWVGRIQPLRLSKQINDFAPNSNELNKNNTICKHCNQNLNNVIKAAILPDAPEEIIAIQNELITLHCEEMNKRSREIQSYKLTNFYIYDLKNHLCFLDKGLIENGVKLYCSGVLKPIFDEDISENGGVKAVNIGPINEWSITGFDGGEKTLILISTDYADYYLMQPSQGYIPYWKNLFFKARLLKITIEYLEDEGKNNPTYPDFLRHVANKMDCDHIEKELVANVEFICSQISSYHRYDDCKYEERNPLRLKCMQQLLFIADYKFKEVKFLDNSNKEFSKFKNTRQTTPSTSLIRNILTMGSTKNGWVNTNLNDNWKDKEIKLKNFELYGDPLVDFRGRKMYPAAKIGTDYISIGDFVLIKIDKKNEPCIMQVTLIYQSITKEFLIHGQLFLLGKDTILESFANSKEIFATENCDENGLGFVLKRINVIISDFNEITKSEENAYQFFVSKKYIPEKGRFLNRDKIDVLKNKSYALECSVCRCDTKLSRKNKCDFETPFRKKYGIHWKGNIYTKGTFLYFNHKFLPEDLNLLIENEDDQISETLKSSLDQSDIYTEKFRKSLTCEKQFKEGLPLVVGLLTSIVKGTYIDINIFLSPKYITGTNKSENFKEDLNEVFWINRSKCIQSV